MGIIGLGYVGLPLAVEIAKAGFKTTGFDVSDKKIALINQGKSYIQDVASEEVSSLVQLNKVSATTNFSLLKECDFISICVPTPLGKGKKPDMSFVIAAATDVQRNLREGHVIILESTTYPGTTEEVVLPMLQKTGLKVGEGFYLAFSPERIDPGNKQFHLKNTPKIIGGVTTHCTEAAQALYQTFIERVIPISSPRAAEMVKILENTFRAINIGLANEIAIMCNQLGIDTWEVIEAAASKPFGFMPFYPGPGLGGHCIPVDPHYLVWKLKSMDYNPRFIQLADEINSSMPHLVVEKITRALNDDRKAVKGSRILVLGVAYKKDIDDCRESPSLEILQILRLRGADVSYYDPFVPELRVDGASMHSVTKDVDFETFDCIVLLTNHSCFDWRVIGDRSRLIVDTRNATKGLRSKARIVKL